MSTYFQSKEAGEAARNWHLVDATDIPLGRLASEVAMLLRGKNKPQFTPHVDGGDFVVVVNASKVKLTGNKHSGKIYRHHSTFIGGLRETTAEEMIQRAPKLVIKEAVEGMLPKGPLGRSIASKLKIFADGEHIHHAQGPKPYKLRFTKATQA